MTNLAFHAVLYMFITVIVIPVRMMYSVCKMVDPFLFHKRKHYSM
jgi:hypothetical protein